MLRNLLVSARARTGIALAVAFGAAPSAHAGGPLFGYQVYAGDFFTLLERAQCVIEVGEGNLVTTGDAFDQFGGDPYQQVTRHLPGGSGVWSNLYFFGPERPSATEAVQAFNTDLLVVGVESSGSERLTIMRIAGNGGFIGAARLEGGGLPAGQDFADRRLSAQAAIALVPGGDPGPVLDRGPIEVPEFAVATTFVGPGSVPLGGGGQQILGQFTLHDPVGAVVSAARYSLPLQFGDGPFRLYDIEPHPPTGGFLLTGSVHVLESKLTRVWPVLMLVDQFGAPVASWIIRFELQSPQVFNESVGTSVLLGPGGECYVAGTTDAIIGDPPGRTGAFLLRFDLPGGMIDWLTLTNEFNPSLRALSFGLSGEVPTVVLSGTAPVPDAMVLGAPTTPHPCLLFLSAGSGAANGFVQYRPSGGAVATDAITHFQGGWQVAGFGAPSGFETPVLLDADSRGMPGDILEMYLARGGMFGDTNCHERRFEPVQIFPKREAVSFNPVAEQVFPETFEPKLGGDQTTVIAEDDCPGVFCPCVGDANGDLEVNFADVTTILMEWLNFYGVGQSGPGDANCNSFVSFADVTSALDNWLKVCIDL